MAKRKSPVPPRLTKENLYQLDCLLDFVSPKDLRDYLLEIYHCYLIRENEMLPENFTRMAESLQVLFDFLKFLEKEGNPSNR
jgi:hypothetical protein